MNITPEQLEIVQKIDSHVNRFPLTDLGTEQLLSSIYDYMEPFKTILDTTTPVQLDYLSQNYSGFYRFSKLLEMMAEGIASGTIDVPHAH